jgi:hypothetical protein
LQDVVHLAFDNLTFRADREPGQLHWPPSIVLATAIKVYEPCAPSHSHQHQTLIHDNAKHPVQELSFTVILVEMFKGPEARVLHFVLALSPVAQHETRDVHTGWIMPVNQYSEGILVARTGECNQFSVSLFAIVLDNAQHGVSLL